MFIYLNKDFNKMQKEVIETALNKANLKAEIFDSGLEAFCTDEANNMIEEYLITHRDIELSEEQQNNLRKELKKAYYDNDYIINNKILTEITEDVFDKLRIKKK